MKMVPIGCPETSVRICQYALRNNLEDRRSHLLCDGRQKSRACSAVGSCSSLPCCQYHFRGEPSFSLPSDSPYKGLTAVFPCSVVDRAAEQRGGPSPSGVPAAEQGAAVFNVPPVRH